MAALKIMADCRVVAHVGGTNCRFFENEFGRRDVVASFADLVLKNSAWWWFSRPRRSGLVVELPLCLMLCLLAFGKQNCG
jgi:hypothetical protein